MEDNLFRKFAYEDIEENSFWKRLVYGTVGLALLSGIYIMTIPNKNILKPRDFSKANWIEYDNKNGRIYSCYEKEVSSLNHLNYKLYADKVSEKNPKGLKGKILLPDLDGDGKVGKIKNPNLKN